MVRRQSRNGTCELSNCLLQFQCITDELYILNSSMVILKSWTNFTKERILTTYRLEEPVGCYQLFFTDVAKLTDDEICDYMSSKTT